jgi:L-aspartate oxidase
VLGCRSYGLLEKGIHQRCLELGIDMRKMPIPVVPAAHYSCGGVVVDDHGRTNVPNLYAVGEVSMTGLHGACRLASNSLLEAMVFGVRAADDVRNAKTDRPADVMPWYAGEATSSDEAVVVTQNWDEIRRLMWNYVGIVRTNRRLARAKHRIDLIRNEIRDYYWNVLVNGDLIELRNIALVADLIIESAIRRRESRGLHYTLDYPDKDPAQQHDTILVRGDGPAA